MNRLVPFVREAMVWTGAGLVSFGAWSAYRPAGFVVAGAFLLAVGVIGEMRAGEGDH